MYISNEQMMRVGREVASLWGAYCTGWHVDENYEIVFECVEDDEAFETTPMSLAYITQEYSYCL